jgi:hypothetical protein
MMIEAEVHTPVDVTGERALDMYYASSGGDEHRDELY